jgi:tetratricopeptide (TPR) repeat protein
MALRLISTNQAADDTASAAAPKTAATAVALGLQARGLLTAGDYQGYHRLFADAAEAEDPQRRYQARVALLEQGLHAARQAATTPATRLYAAVAEAALTVLEDEPSEPMVLNYAGVACYELWALDAAQSLFGAARRLDPGLANIDSNLAEVGRRRGSAGRRRRPLHAAVPGLSRRAKSVGQRARAATGLTLSVCMIVRDEEQMLPRSLAAVAPAVDEIIVVDTGSTDDTIAIAKSFGAKVIEFPWNGSFADARNASFAAAGGDWLLYLDADEILVGEDVEKLRSLTGHTWREAFYIDLTSYTGELGDGVAVANNALRIFRNRPGYRFEGRIHEQIVGSLPTWAPGRIEHTHVRVQHYGYLGSVRDSREKYARNVKLLREQLAESTPTPFLHFNLGTEYAAAGEHGAAFQEFSRSWTMLQEQGGVKSCEFAPALVVRLVKSQRACAQVKAAQTTAEQGLELFPNLTDLVLEQAFTALAIGSEDEAERHLHRCIELGDAPAAFGGMVGSGTYLPRVALAQLHLRRGDVQAARPLLDWCVDHHPDYLGVVEPYAAALVGGGMSGDDVVAEVQRRLDGITPSVRCALARALRRGGDSAAAETQYRLGLAGQAANSAARIGLAELLLARGRYAEAAEQAALVPDKDPYCTMARRLELCGQIAGDDVTGARATFGRAVDAGLPAAERDVFQIWMTIIEGGSPRAGLSTAGVPLLGVVLDMLLAAGDITRFEALAPVLTHSRLEVREQHELLASMYLTHGHAARAASEWMAVCSEAPDARALVGLARVAAGQGMLDDAATFAGGALELDPESGDAAALLARLDAVRAPAAAA